jgi:lipopolysaccharide export system protein LptC
MADEVSAPFDEKLPFLTRNRLSDQERHQRSQSHSRLVRLLRLFLPVLAVVILGVLFLWPSQQDILQKQQEQTSLSKDPIGQNQLIKPEFHAEDDRGNPYTISAAQATQSSDNLNVILLDQPKARMELSAQEWIEIKAESGKFDQGAKTLSLQKNVVFTNHQGYSFQAQDLSLDLGQKLSETKNPVSGSGPIGHIQAQGMRADSTSNRLIFLGPATFTLQQNLKLP